MGFLDNLFGRNRHDGEEVQNHQQIEEAQDAIDNSEQEDDKEIEDPWAAYEEGMVYADDGWPGTNSLEVLERDEDHIRFLVMPRNTFVIKDGVKYFTGMGDAEHSITGFIKEWTFATPADMELVSGTGFDFVDVPCMTETQIDRDTGATRHTFESYIVSGSNLDRVMTDVRSAISAYVESGLEPDFTKHAKTLLKAEPFDPASVDFEPVDTKYNNGSFKFKIQKRTAKKGAIPKIPLIIEGSFGRDNCHAKAVLYYTANGYADRVELFMSRNTTRTSSYADVVCKTDKGEFAPDKVEPAARR